MNQQSAKTVPEFRVVIDELEKAYNSTLASTTDKDLSEANNRLSTMFRAVQWNLYTLAQAAQRKVDARRAEINSGRLTIEKVEKKAEEELIEEVKKVDVLDEAIEKLDKAVKRRGRPKKVKD